jgi:purine-nucleoside phosphorylase
MTPAELYAQCAQLTAELVIAKEQYAALYKVNQELAKVAAEALTVLDEIIEHEKKQ